MRPLSPSDGLLLLSDLQRLLSEAVAAPAPLSLPPAAQALSLRLLALDLPPCLEGPEQGGEFVVCLFNVLSLHASLSLGLSLREMAGGVEGEGGERRALPPVGYAMGGRLVTLQQLQQML